MKVSILTLNIFGVPKNQEASKFDQRLPEILTMLTKINADVVCLQEVPLSHLNEIDTWAKQNKLTCTPPSRANVQCIIYAKQPPTQTTCLKLPNPSTLDYHMIEAKFAWGNVINCHLHHGAQNQSIRNDQMQFIAQHRSMEDRDLTVICGDFNMPFYPNSHLALDQLKTALQLKKSTVIDVVPANVATLSPQNPLSEPGRIARPDGIFIINPHQELTYACQRVLDTPLPPPLHAYSDHFGLLVNLTTQKN